MIAAQKQFFVFKTVFQFLIICFLDGYCKEILLQLWIICAGLIVVYYSAESVLG